MYILDVNDVSGVGRGRILSSDLVPDRSLVRVFLR